MFELQVRASTQGPRVTKTSAKIYSISQWTRLGFKITEDAWELLYSSVSCNQQTVLSLKPQRFHPLVWPGDTACELSGHETDYTPCLHQLNHICTSSYTDRGDWSVYNSGTYLVLKDLLIQQCGIQGLNTWWITAGSFGWQRVFI